MKVTIITSCYNRAGTVRRAIESVLRQTYKDIEYIVVDGGSTDGSRDIIEEYRDRITKVILQPDRGIYEGLNNGLRQATGDVVAVCHSDDQLHDEHTVADVVKAFEAHPATELLYADGLYVDDAGRAVRVWKSGTMKHWKVAWGWLPLHTTCYIRRDVYRRYGLYDEGYRIAADTKLLLALLYVYEVKTLHLPRYVVKMRMGGASTDRGHVRAMWHEDIRAFHEVGVPWPTMMKLAKMAWKPMQFLRGLLSR